MRQIEVNIIAAIGEGKTAVAVVVAKAPKDAGFTVRYGENLSSQERKHFDNTMAAMVLSALEPMEIIMYETDKQMTEGMVYRNGRRMSETDARRA